jgi:hypothetical protein
MPIMPWITWQSGNSTFVVPAPEEEQRHLL